MASTTLGIDVTNLFSGFRGPWWHGHADRILNAPQSPSRNAGVLTQILIWGLRLSRHASLRAFGEQESGGFFRWCWGQSHRFQHFIFLVGH